MDTRERADLFARYVGLELKGRITAQGFTAKDVAIRARRSPAAFNRWLNGRVEIPLAVVYEACDVIGVSPTSLVATAIERVVRDAGSDVHVVPSDSNVSGRVQSEDIPIAAKRGRRKGDVESFE